MRPPGLHRWAWTVAVLASLGAGRRGEEGPAPSPPSDQLLRRIDQVKAPAETFTFDATVTVYRGDRVTSTSDLTVHVGDATKALALYRAPAEHRGRAVLMIGRDLWVHLPRDRRTVRIRPGQRVATEAAYADVVRMVLSRDYRLEDVAREVVGGQEQLRVLARAATPGAAYDGVRIWVAPDTARPIRAELLAPSGRVLKEQLFGGYEMVLGRERPTRIEVRNSVDSDERVVFAIRAMRVEEVPAAFFEPNLLGEAR